MTDYDAEKFRALTEYAYDLQASNSERDEMLQAMEEMYSFTDKEVEKLEKQFKNIVIAMSPSASNAIETAVRLLTSNEPGINAPEEMNKSYDVEILDAIEKFARLMLRHSDRIRGSPVYVDAARSGILYDEIHISVNKTSDLVEYARGRSPGLLRRAERVARLTPYVFNVHDPHGCYADWDILGLRAWARRTEMSAQRIVEEYGKAGEEALSSYNKVTGRTTSYIVWTMWDMDYYACWIENATRPIHFRPNELGMIPVVVQIVEGSEMFSEEKLKRRPLLYRMWKSGVWSNQNIALSAIYTRARTRMWASYLYKAPSDEPSPEIDLTMPINIVQIDPRYDMLPLPTDPGNNELWQAWNLADVQGAESTIYKQVAGQPLGPNATYSETALLSQAGRLPLVSIQRKLEWALGDALRMAFLWMKNEPQVYESVGRGVTYELNAEDIPDDLEIEVSLDIALPQDRLQQANIFNILKDRVPDEYLYEHLLNERQPKEMVRKLWQQRVRDALLGLELQQRLMQQQPQPQPQQAEVAPQGVPPEMMMGGMQGPEMPRSEMTGEVQ